jgi:hypothetical protein
MNCNLGYANCFPFLISIQSCPSSIESSSPKVAVTRLSSIVHQSCFQKYAEIFIWCPRTFSKHFIVIFLISKISIQQSHVVSITNTTILTTQFKGTDQLVLLTTSAGLLGFKKTSSSILLVKTVEFIYFAYFSVTTHHRK